MIRTSILSAALALPLAVSAQSDSQNYVQERLCLDSLNANSTTRIAYYDGIGQLTETVTTGDGQSVYSLTAYDSKGREWRSYLPVPYGNTLSFVPSEELVAISSSFYNDATAFKQNHYNAIGQITSEELPGSSWRSNNKANVMSYSTNTTADRVLHYQAPLGIISLVKPENTSFAYYPEGSLTKETKTDADGHYVTVFKDLAGNTILERRNMGDTYYVYNALGQLRYVLSPMYQLAGYKSMYAYEYRYDTRGNLVKKTLPGCECSQYWYDKEKRLVFTQTARLREKGRYRFTLYDAKGRMAVQGTCSSCRRSLENTDLHVTYKGYQQGFMGTRYELSSPDAIDTTDAILEKICFYDAYSFLSGFHGGEFAKLSPHLADNATGRMTGEIILTSNGQYVYRVYYYDVKGNLTEALCKGLDDYASNVANTYTFTDKLGSSSITVDVKYGTDFIAELNSTYNIHNDKLESSSLSLQHGMDPGVAEVGYSYDALGRLSQISRPQPVGPVNYAYDMHGWVSRIESNSFQESLHYADGLGVPCYNGDISSMTWSSSTYDQLMGYTFQYDQLDRLTNAVYGERVGRDNRTNRYDEHLEYDVNGNITRLQRRGLKQDGQYGKIDNLHIYHNGNQLSSISDDAARILYAGAFDFNNAANGQSEYAYDASGSLVSDTGRGIAMTEYDDCGNPLRMQFTNGNVTSYVYTVDGQKLRTVHYTAMPNITVTVGETHDLSENETLCKDSTDYLLGGSLILQDGRIDKYLFDGGFAQGRPNEITISQPVFPYDWDDNGEEATPEQIEAFHQALAEWEELMATEHAKDELSFYYYNQDHLGNIREVIDGLGHVVQATNYYPSGTPYCDAVSTINPSLQPFKYNGKELDMMHGLNTYDYGARQYNPVVLAWDRVDPLCEKYYNVSPYMYCHGNPMRYIDPNGEYDFENTIQPNTIYNVIAVFPTKYADDESRALIIDHDEAMKHVPVILVDNMSDFADAMAALAKMRSSTKLYTLNSHGYGGSFDNPAHFYIGDDLINCNTDFGQLSDGLKDKVVFIGACNVGSLNGLGGDLVENMSKVTSSTVISSLHPVPAGYEFEGGYELNFCRQPPLLPDYSDNEYMYSSNGSTASIIKDVRIDAKSGIHWKDDFKYFYPH